MNDIIKYLSVVMITIATILFIMVMLWKRKVSKFPTIANPPSIPVIGNAYYLSPDPREFYLQLRGFSQSSDYLFVLWFFHIPSVQAGRVEYVEYLLSNQEHLKKSMFYDFFLQWLGTGVLMSDGEKWKKRRRAVTPSFHFSILTEFQKIFVEQSKIFVEKLSHMAGTGESFDIQTPVSLVTLDIICETAMGVSVNAQSNKDSDYVNALNEINKEIKKRQMYPWLWNDWIYSCTKRGRNFHKHLKILHDFTVSVINDRIAAREKSTEQKRTNNSRTVAFLDMLLDLYDKDEIDIDGIREEVDTFMFEGHDTTAAGLSWTLYCLGNNMDVQKKLLVEVDKASKEKGDLIDRIKSIKYLEYVIKEGLRLHPPVPFFGRVLERDTVIDNVKYPAGTELIVDTISVHTNPKYWDRPLDFYPERFGEEKFVQRNPYTYIPFSAGPRNCVGQKFAMLEEKILLYHIILNFEIHSTQKEEEVRSCADIIHKSDNGLLIKLSLRCES